MALLLRQLLAGGGTNLKRSIPQRLTGSPTIEKSLFVISCYCLSGYDEDHIILKTKTLGNFYMTDTWKNFY